MKRPRNELLPGEVWSFPDNSGVGRAHLRVLLRIVDLNASSLDFVVDGYLVQISHSETLGEEAFEKDQLLLDGTILVKDGYWKRHGFARVGEMDVSLSDIEFPCWFGYRSRQLFFSRGELRSIVTMLDPKELEARWESCFLARQTPSHFSRNITISTGEIGEMAMNDARYHPQRAEILEFVGQDLAASYCDLLPPERLEVYRRAISYGQEFR